MQQEKKRFLLPIFIFSLACYTLIPEAIYSQQQQLQTVEPVEEDQSDLPPPECRPKNGYTINFNNVSIVEYIRFVSKITKLNFLFEQNDLNFNVTVVSEEPITTKNILSTLMQILRIHGLTLLEQENSLLITTSKDVAQISTLVSGELKDQKNCPSPIVTRVFRLKQGNPVTIGSIIRPMISASALLEISLETKQIIITDIVTNVDKIASLITVIDTPHSNLEIDSYTAKYVSSAELIKLATQLLAPFAEGSPLVFVPQPSSNQIFIVSTPHLLERAAGVLEDLDIPVQSKISPQGVENIFIYKTVSKSPEELQKSLKKTADEMQAYNSAPLSLIEALRSATVIQESESLFFLADAETMPKVTEILSMLDIASSGPQSFFLYKLLYAQGNFIQNYLDQVAKNLKDSSEISNSPLITAIQKVKWIKESNSLLLTGPISVIDRIKKMISEVDIMGSLPTMLTEKTSFLLYEPKSRSAADLQNAFREIVQDLQGSGLVDPNLISTLSSAHFIRSTNSLLFTGTQAALDKVTKLLTTIDVPFVAQVAAPPATTTGSNTGSTGSVETGSGPGERTAEGYKLYVVKFGSGDALIQTVQEFVKSLKKTGVDTPDLYETVTHLKWIEKTNRILVTGSTDAITRGMDILQQFDVSSSLPSVASLDNVNFLIYKLQYHQGEEIKAALKQVISDLAKTNPHANQGLADAVNSLQWIKMTNSLLTTGQPQILEKMRDLIQNIDIPLKQVFIEVLIIDTQLSNNQDFGVQWGGKGQYFNKVGGSFGNFPAANPNGTSVTNPVFAQNLQGINATTTPTGTSVPFSQGFDLGVIGDIIMHKGKSFVSLGALVTALQTDGDSTIVLNPKIIAQDNNNSTIFVGNNTPYVGSLVQTTGGGTSSATTTSLEYRDIGINLSITPVLGDGDMITLTINTDLSAIINTAQISTSGVSGITTSHTNMNTKVTVPDNHFVALSGLINDTKSHFKSGIPCLGGLPVIGLAFSDNQRSDTKHNILIFLRPHIINNAEDYREETERQENLFREAASLKILKEEFDIGLDYVKQEDDE